MASSYLSARRRSTDAGRHCHEHRWRCKLADVERTGRCRRCRGVPVAGEHGSTFALMTNSRTPMALGNAGRLAAPQPLRLASQRLPQDNGFIAWVVAGLASVVLLFAVGSIRPSLAADAGPALGTRPVGHSVAITILSFPPCKQGRHSLMATLFFSGETRRPCYTSGQFLHLIKP